MGSQSKVLSYAGFAVKAGKVVYGASLIRQFKKRLYLLVLCHTASENAEKEAYAIADHQGIVLVRTKAWKLEDAVNKTNCKLAGFSDENLAQAIIGCVDGENLELVRGGALNG